MSKTQSDIVESSEEYPSDHFSPRNTWWENNGYGLGQETEDFAEGQDVLEYGTVAYQTPPLVPNLLPLQGTSSMISSSLIVLAGL